jgi:divalent metal cation (Fe/Co/Zn/Cd) transporter
VVDLVASIIAWFSIKKFGKPAIDGHRYGHGTTKNVAGSIEVFLIFGAATIS